MFIFVLCVCVSRAQIRSVCLVKLGIAFGRKRREEKRSPFLFLSFSLRLGYAAHARRIEFESTLHYTILHYTPSTPSLTPSLFFAFGFGFGFGFGFVLKIRGRIQKQQDGWPRGLRVEERSVSEWE